MLALETDFPEVYTEFQNGNFAVQLSDVNTFGKVESDKVIGMTINRDTKTPGGTNSNAIHQWVINGPYRAGMEKQLNDFVQLRQKSHLHHDLLPTRIKQDENAVKCLIYIMTNTFINPFSDSPF